MRKACYGCLGLHSSGGSWGGGYMLHHIHCREFTQQGSKQLGLLIFITLFDSQFCFYPQHAPYPKPAVKDNKSCLFVFVCFASQFVKSFPEDNVFGKRCLLSLCCSVFKPPKLRPRHDQDRDKNKTLKD